MTAFVGTERAQLVDELVAQLDSCIAANRPHLTCLTAEAGWGKTRVVHEFYRRLQQRQQSPKYWPEAFDGEDEDPIRGRKVMYPTSIQPEPGATLPWFWWGLRCEEDSGGRKVRALFNDRSQMRAHLSGLVEAANRKTARRALALTVLGEVVGFAPGIGQAVGLAMAGKEAYEHLRNGFGRGSNRRGRDLERKSIDVARRDLSEIEPELELVRQFISPALPLVLAVDDAHDADAGTVEFLRQVILLDAPVLVVATAWPSELDDQAQDESLTDPADRTSFGGLLAALRDELPDVVSRRDLTPLTDHDLARIVDEAAPATANETREALVENAGGNPLVLRLQLTSPKVVRSVADGAIALTPAELHQLPRGYASLIGDRYFDLPEPEQRWLAEAAFQGERFFPDTMSAAVEPLDPDLLGAFVRITAADEMRVGRFIERPVHRGVLSAAEREYSETERRAWDSATLDALERFWQADSRLPRDLASRRDLCRLILRYAEDLEDVVPDVLVVSAAARTWSYTERDLGRHAEELQVAEDAMRWADKEPRDPRNRALAAMRLSGACRATNRPHEAVAACQMAVTIVEDEFAVLEDLRCDAWGFLAMALLQNDDLEAAADAAAKAESFAVEDYDHIWALRTLAMVEHDRGQLTAAVNALNTALERARAMDPPDVEEVIDIETDITDLDPSSGSSERWRAHAALAEQQLGTGHWLHLVCLGSLAWRLIQDGDLTAAEPVVERLEELEESGAEEYSSLWSPALRALLAGDVQAMSAWMREFAQKPYTRSSDARNYSVVGSLFGGSAGRHGRGDEGAPGASGLFAVLELVPQSVDVALERLRHEIKHSRATWDGSDYWLCSMLGTSILSDWLISKGALHPSSDEFVASLRELMDGIADFPSMGRAFLDAYDAAAAISRGRAAGARPSLGLPAFELRSTLCFAVAWASAGDRERSEAELQAARTQATSIGSWSVWHMIGVAHTTCRSSHTVEVWKAATRIPDAGSSEVLIAQTYIADALVDEERPEEAIALLERSLAAHSTEDHPVDAAELVAKSDLAKHLETTGILDRARVLREEVLEGRRAIFGRESPAALDAEAALGYTCYRLGDYSAARALEEHVVQGRTDALGGAHWLTALAKVNLAWTLLDLGDLPGARELSEQVVAVRRRELGADDPETLSAETLLGLTYFRLGDFAAARPLEEHVEAVRSTTLGDGDESTLDAKANLAVTLEELGDLAAARRLREQLLGARRRKLGDDHERTLLAETSLAVTCYRLGDFAAARPLGEHVVAVRSAKLGDRDPATLSAKEDLASTLEELGELAAAVKLREEVLSANRQEHGDEDQRTVDAESLLGGIRFQMNDHAGARPLAEHVVAVRSATLGDDHEATVVARENLATVLEALPDLAVARELRQQLLEIRRKELGADDPAVLLAEAALAVACYRLGDFAAARSLEEHVVTVRSATLGEDHEATLEAEENLAVTLEALADFLAARGPRERVLTVRRRDLGADHPATLNAEAALIVTYHHLGDYEAALPCAEHYASVLADRLADGDERVSAAKLSWAATLEALHAFAPARELREQVLAVFRRDLGDDHPRTLWAEAALGVTCYRQGDFAAARPLEEHVVAVRSAKLGDRDESTLVAKKNLALTLQGLEDLPAAQQLLDEVEAAARVSV